MEVNELMDNYWGDIFNLPFMGNEYQYVWDSSLDTNIVFQFGDKVTEDLKKKILHSLNSPNLEIIEGLTISISSKDDTIVLDKNLHKDEDNEDYLIMIRGWVYLTGRGGLFLTDEQAESYQKGFRDWIIYKLTGI